MHEIRAIPRYFQLLESQIVVCIGVSRTGLNTILGGVTARHVWLARQMPTGLRDMDRSSGHTLPEVLRTLGTKLVQEANSIR